MDAEPTPQARPDELAPDASPHSRTRMVLAIAIVIGFFGFISMAVFVKVADQQIALVAVGYVSGAATAVVSFYFGSSAGSEQKSAALEKQLPKQ